MVKEALVISITKTGYELICRTVNYVQWGAKVFQSLDFLDKTQLLKTRNFFLEYDSHFRLLSQKEIIENLPRERRILRNVTGLEDCRLFKWGEKEWFSCTTVDTSLYGLPQVSLGMLAQDRSKNEIHVEKLITLEGPHPEICEKNWLPFIKEGALHLIYSYNPFIIYKPEIDFTNQKLIHRNEYIADTLPYDTSRFSGSAPPILFEEGYLFVIHEVVYNDQQERSYLHRFIYMDKSFKIRKMSKPFTFMNKKIEYCCGITLNHENNKVITTIGIEDCKAYLCEVEVDTVRIMLESVPTSSLNERAILNQ